MEQPDQNDHVLYCFTADFDAAQSIVRKAKRPLGYYATQVLLLSDRTINELAAKATAFTESLPAFLNARTPSATAVSNHALQEYWNRIRKLPGFKEQLSGRLDTEKNSRILRWAEDAAVMDRLVTKGTPEQQELEFWLGALKRLPEDVRLFKKNTDWMLKEYFHDLPDRSKKSYANALLRFQVELDSAMQQAQMELELADDPDKELDFELAPIDPRTVSFGAEVSVSVTPYLTPKGDGFVERMTFSCWKDFITMDLYRGMAAGNLPRVCENCGRYFLTHGAYRTIYCERVAPGEKKRTCREVGAHAKERQKIDTDYARKAYQRAYNRIKMRRYRGRMSEDDFLTELERLDDLKDRMAHCEIHSAEFDRLVKELNPTD